MENPRIEVLIPTKQRYEFLALCIQSLTTQTYDNWDLLIVDDSEKPVNLTQIPFIAPFLNWMLNNKHEWRVLFGRKLGQHHCHQIGLEAAKSNLILRVDDDCVLDPNYMEMLVRVITTQDHCVAVSGLVLDPNLKNEQQLQPENWKEIKDYSGKVWEDEKGNPQNSPALQWHCHRDKDLSLVQHLHSTFLYRKAPALAVGGWQDMIDAGLSRVAMTEETWFTYKLYLAGWSMFVNPNVVAWHLKASFGGCRTDAEKEDLSKLYFADRGKFDAWYKENRKK
jgi:GT2 family glycosyltransferase